MKKTIPNVLTIAGSDPSGGAGIQADLKVFAALDCYGMAVITSLTAQNTQGVRGVISVPDRFVTDQLAALFEDINIDAVKIGMLGSADIIHALADSLERYRPAPIVLDPVMVASSGEALLSADALGALKERLIPLADIITPNIPEAERLMRKSVIDMARAAEDLRGLGAKAVLLKGGHLKGDVMRDVLAYAGGMKTYEAPRIETQNTHGTGCTLSSALAAYLARGHDLVNACGHAKTYVTQALKHADDLNVGAGHGPLHHGFKGARADE